MRFSIEFFSLCGALLLPLVVWKTLEAGFFEEVFTTIFGLFLLGGPFSLVIIFLIFMAIGAALGKKLHILIYGKVDETGT